MTKLLEVCRRDISLPFLIADMTEEGLLGVAIISGVALAAGLMGSALWRGMSRKR